MTNYDFECNECGKVFIIKKSTQETMVPSCPVCESPNAKRIGEPIKQSGCGGCSSGGSCGGGCGCK